MKQTLLEMVQDILYSMDGDEITSITDNYESRQVARIVRECYWNLIPIINPSETYTFFKLTESSASTPTVMTMPTDCISFDWVKYNKIASGETDPVWDIVYPLNIKTFWDNMHSLRESADTTVDSFSYTINGNTETIFIKNNAAPMFYSMFNDGTVIFNSYDSDVETYLRTTKTMLYGKEDQSFTLLDDFTPNLDAEQFPLLLQESISTAWARMKQTEYKRGEREARRQRLHTQNGLNKDNQKNRIIEFAGYGRK